MITTVTFTFHKPVLSVHISPAPVVTSTTYPTRRAARKAIRKALSGRATQTRAQCAGVTYWAADRGVRGCKCVRG